MASEACCTIPPVVPASIYETQGTYTTLSGMRIYQSGSVTSTTGVLVIYDIFGLDIPQTLQGIDIIASTGHLTIAPDFFHGSPMPMNGFPTDTPAKREALTAFFTGPASPPKNIGAVMKLVPELREKFPTVKKWALVGLCWGGKIATLLSGTGLFAASAQIHPAMLDPKDAEGVTIPHFLLATKDEDKDATEKFGAALKKEVKEKSVVLRWEGTFHGFMGARANLDDKENVEYYEKGYKELVNFLKATL